MHPDEFSQPYHWAHLLFTWSETTPGNLRCPVISVQIIVFVTKRLLNPPRWVWKYKKQERHFALLHPIYLLTNFNLLVQKRSSEISLQWTRDFRVGAVHCFLSFLNSLINAGTSKSLLGHSSFSLKYYLGFGFVLLLAAMMNCQVSLPFYSKHIKSCGSFTPAVTMTFTDFSSG